MTSLRIIFCLMIFLLAIPVSAFSPNDVAVVYNQAPQIANASHGVALYYAQARGIPQANIIGITPPPNEGTNDYDYVHHIATPIWNELSKPAHSNIKVIVMCYGIPFRIWTPTSKGSIDAALMLLGNPNILNVTHWGLNLTNPFYNSTVGWDEFRDSPANTINAGSGRNWKLNYLVTRLDGYGEPKTTITIGSDKYSIPSDIKGMIDRAVRADKAGRAGLSSAIAVIDDAPGSFWVHSPSTISTLNSLLQPITGSSDNVRHEPGNTATDNAFAINKHNVVAYSSPGSYDGSAEQVTTFWRPHNTWKDGAVALYWNVSSDATYIRTPTYGRTWNGGRDKNSANIEPGIFKVIMTGRMSSLYDGVTLCLCGPSQPRVLLAQSKFQGGIARIDLSKIQWPSNHKTYFELHFASNDPYHPNEKFAQIDLGVDLYEAKTEGYTYNSGPGQSLSAELIRDGATATAGNVQEPYGNNTPNPNVILPKYASGFTWAESAWMGIPHISWEQIAIGDPLMAPFAKRPSVTITSPTTAGSAATGTTKQKNKQK